MAFWSENTAAPKRNFRFQLTIEGFGGDSAVWWAKTVNTPSFDVSEVEHNYFDNKYYFPGRVSWSEVEATLVDPVSPDAMGLTLAILEGSGYNVTAQPGAKATLAKAKATNFDGNNQNGMGNVTIDIMDADNKIVESWTLKNAFIKAAKFGDLDYSNDELRTISLTMRYDWAQCTISNRENESRSGAKADPYFKPIDNTQPTIEGDTEGEAVETED